MSGLWVYAEHREGKIKKVVYEILTAGRELAKQLGEEVAAVLIGSGVEGLAADLGQYGADKVFVLDDPKLEQYSPDGYTKAMADLAKNENPSIVLMGCTATGKDFAPRLAASLGAGLSSDCTAIELNDQNKLVVSRPIYAGKAYIRVECPEATPQMATIRPNILGVGEKEEGKTAEVVKVAPEVSDEDIRAKIVDVIMTAGERVDLTEADIIVSGGRGTKGAENFSILEELADVLGAAVGASRAAVDAGWREQQFQVGQTGKVVSPQLYIACGISGAIQHLAGMRTSKVIVAVNRDPEAPIFKIADYGIVGDLFKVVPIMTEEFKKLLAEA